MFALTHLTSLFVIALALVAPALAARPTESGTYTISPRKFPHLCLAPVTPTNGAHLTLKNCDTSDDIVWRWSGQAWHNLASNKCVDVKDGGRWNGNKLQVWECFSYNTNQMYILPNAQIQWAGQNFCWDLTDGRGQAGNEIQQWNCFDHNDNQMWDFVDAEEVDECSSDAATTNYLVSATRATTPTTTATMISATMPMASPSVDAQLDASPSALGNGFLAGEQVSSRRSRSRSAAAATGAATTAAAAATTSPAASPSPSPPSTGSGASSASKLRTRGTKVVDASGAEIILRGTNLGGWLVYENWMCGMDDSYNSGDRFPQWTLEQRFGEAQTKALMNVWMDNWLVAGDFDRIKALGFNVVRLPFSYKNFYMNDGSDNDVGFTRLDWAIGQAKRVGIYVIPVYHIWDTQKERYSLISENSNEGQAARDKAGALWRKIAARYLNEPAIAAWDAINEPTGSWGDLLQRNLYDAIRSVDKDRIIIQASIGTNPANYGWTNVIYTQHEYKMMEGDVNSNRGNYAAGPAASIADFTGIGIPTYIGEFMADGSTLDYMLQQLNQAGVWWSSWTLKTVQMDRWGLFNFGNSMRVNVGTDSYDAIRQKWSNMGGLTRQAVADQYQQYAGARKKRDLDASPAHSPRAAVEAVDVDVHRRAHAHLGRSRRAGGHGAVRAKVF